MDVVKESPVYASDGFTTGGTVVTITPVSVSYNLTESLEGGKPVTMASIGLGGFIDKVKDFGKSLTDRIMDKAGKYD